MSGLTVVSNICQKENIYQSLQDRLLSNISYQLSVNLKN